MGILVIALLVSSPAFAASPQAASEKYTNPLSIQAPNDEMVESCADPSILHGQTPGDNYWYMYCTTDPLNDADKTGSDFNFHLIPVLRSSDLVNWTYMGDAFSTRPAWVDPTSGFW